ncbi:MAG: molybdopterin-dependent oxidoreductase [Granulosicoccaceae bacterium]
MEMTSPSPSSVHTTCPYCGVGCGVDVACSQASVTVTGTPDHPANQGRLCVKGSALHETLDTNTRLLNPQLGDRTCSWDEALDAVATKFREIINSDGPDAVAFYVSGQLLTEDYYVANKLMKGFIGSGNIDTNSRLCMSSAVSGYKRALGSDTVPCDYTDLEEADLLVITGSNTAWAHPVVYQRIEAAKRKRPEMRIVCIDPRRTATADLADLHLPIQPGSDTMLFTGLLHYLCQNNAVDEDFVSSHTKGLVKALAVSTKLVSDTTKVAARTGLHVEQVRLFFNWFTQTEKTVTLFSQGLNQSVSGTDNANAVINCHLLTGRIGKAGTGPFSMTGQPNAMGGREVGGLATQLAAHMDFGDSKALERISWFWNTNNLARKPGLKAIDLFEAINTGKVKAVWIMGTNPAVSMPQADKVSSALKNCEFVVVSDCEANTDTTRHADVLLPAMAWGEKSGTVTNSERCISRQRAFLPACGQARADWWIITQVAQRLGYARKFNYTSSAQIFREHAALSAFENNGTRDFDIGALADLSDDEYDQLKPTQWPCPQDSKPKRLYADGHFFTNDRRANFIPVSADNTPRRSPYFPYMFNTGRIRDQWHTMTRTAKSPRLLQHIDQPYVEIHPEDAAALNVHEGQLVSLQAHKGSNYVAKANISERQQRGSVFAPIHWNEQFANHAKCSSLSSSKADPYSGQPAFKHSTVAIETLNTHWTACIVSRKATPLPDCSYACRIPLQGLQRLELAGVQPIANPKVWLQQQSLAEGEWMVYQDPALGNYRAACVKSGELQALIYYTEKGKLPNRKHLGQFFDLALNATNCRAILAGKVLDGDADTSSVICACHEVSENQITAAITQKNCTTTQALGEHLSCGTGCGSCLPELEALLQQTEVRER